jgi:NAD(P)-dependent dehydrogenase (short-subunit alcohol dehydrogenase family)
MSTLEGKVALVTGGAQGLGEAICRTLSEIGATVVVADIREDQAEALASELETNGKKVQPLVLDVCNEVMIERAIQRIRADHGRLRNVSMI